MTDDPTRDLVVVSVMYDASDHSLRVDAGDATWSLALWMLQLACETAEDLVTPPTVVAIGEGAEVTITTTTETEEPE